MKDWLLAGEFSKKTGLSLKALRLYEDKGILISHTRGENNYRYYSLGQIENAKVILEYKQLGFSLDQIKIILDEGGIFCFLDILDKQIEESQKQTKNLEIRLSKLLSIKSSLNSKSVLTEEQRGVFMANLFENSINNLKRQGLSGSEVEAYLKREIEVLSPEKKELLAQVKNLIIQAQERNIKLGPGRMNSAASIILLGEGVSSLNPVEYGLMPETFAFSKIMMIDVEYSNHQFIGELCEQISKDLQFEVVAFRNPLLDIYKKIQDIVGEIAFDKFLDEDPRILGIASSLGRTGIYGIDWNPNYQAFQMSNEEYRKEFTYTDKELDSLFNRYVFESPQDYVNQMTIMRFLGRESLKQYRSINKEKIVPELIETKGLLLYREDWIKIYMRAVSCDFSIANEKLNILREKALADDKVLKDENLLLEITDLGLRFILLNSVTKLQSKSNQVSWWWHFKRTAILKLLWKDLYLQTIVDWEKENKIIWQEFGFKYDGGYHLKA